jgi:hypothetical protein
MNPFLLLIQVILPQNLLLTSSVTNKRIAAARITGTTIFKNNKMAFCTGSWKNNNNNQTSSTEIPVPTDEENSTILENDDAYIVTVDSRAHSSPSDMECYKESSCKADFFRDHIRDDPKNICVKSQIAGLCGLDLKIYFHDHKYHITKLEELEQPLSPIGRVNGAATLLTFNPETGKFNHVVFGKAYVLLNEGHTPLSKRQVWGIVELIREARHLYKCLHDTYKAECEQFIKHHHVEERTDPKALHRNHSDSPALQEAYAELLTRCSQYQHETWVPHGIYEPRHPHDHHHHLNAHHGHLCHKSAHPEKDTCCGCKTNYRRMDSGKSDAATCHHGACHQHHLARDDISEFVQVKPVKHHHRHRHHHHGKDAQDPPEQPVQE